VVYIVRVAAFSALAIPRHVMARSGENNGVWGSPHALFLATDLNMYLGLEIYARLHPIQRPRLSFFFYYHFIISSFSFVLNPTSSLKQPYQSTHLLLIQPSISHPKRATPLSKPPR
jgi:hypothetical protein